MKCRALLDTGAGSSYASAALLNLLQVRPDQRQVRQIERMLGAATKKVEIFLKGASEFYLGGLLLKH